MKTFWTILVVSIIIIAFVVVFLPKELWLPIIIISPIPPIP